MAEVSSIEWTDSTFNPWIGCTKISTAATGGGGCDNCYAAKQDNFRRWTPEGWGGPRKRTGDDTWGKPKKWNAQPFLQCPACGWRGEWRRADERQGACPRCGVVPPRFVDARRRVFCASLADVFDNQVPQQWRADLFALIAATPNLDWLLLTKRIGNAAAMIAEAQGDKPPVSKWDAWPLPNVWLGATVVNQEEADRDIPKLLATPACVRFLSMEPLLGPVDLRMVAVPAEQDQLRRPWEFEGSKFNALQLHDEDRFHQPPAAIDWVIVGGESGPDARPMHPEWARSLRDQCAAAGVPFLFKQWGEWTPGENVERQRGTVDTAFLWNGAWHIHPLNLATDHGHIDDEPDLYRVGKKAAGRLLDGVEHNGFPEVR